MSDHAAQSGTSEQWLGGSTVKVLPDGSLQISARVQGGPDLLLRAWPGWAEELARKIEAKTAKAEAILGR